MTPRTAAACFPGASQLFVEGGSSRWPHPNALVIEIISQGQEHPSGTLKQLLVLFGRKTVIHTNNMSWTPDVCQAETVKSVSWDFKHFVAVVSNDTAWNSELSSESNKLECTSQTIFISEIILLVFLISKHFSALCGATTAEQKACPGGWLLYRLSFYWRQPLFPLAVSCQLGMVSGLEMGLCAHFLFSVLALVWLESLVCISPVQAISVSLGSYVCQLCCVWKLCVLGVTHTLALRIFLPPLSQSVLSLEGFDKYIPILGWVFYVFVVVVIVPCLFCFCFLQGEKEYEFGWIESWGRIWKELG